MALTADIILNRCKVNSLESVKSLQCWGMKFNDVSVLNNAVNLEVLNLSCNNISSLKQIESCKSLRQVYLRKNKISDISELQHLQSLHNLQVLWLNDNPISSMEDYRLKVLNYLPHLIRLDDIIVTNEERESAINTTTTTTTTTTTATLRESQDIDKSHHQIAEAILMLVPLLDKTTLIRLHNEIKNTIDTLQ